MFISSRPFGGGIMFSRKQVVRFIIRDHDYYRRAAVAFMAGLKFHGIDTVEIASADYVPADDIVVVWSGNYPDIMRKQTEAGGHTIIMEVAYFGERLNALSFSVNGLHGMGDFVPGQDHNMPSDRWEATGLEIAPWRDRAGKPILIAGQTPGDAQMDGVDPIAWAARAAVKLRNAGCSRLLFRPHPNSRKGAANVQADTVEGDLLATLRMASCVVTYSSNIAVDALLYGVPFIAVSDGSMAREVTGSGILAAMEPPLYDLTQWSHDLAYCQWSLVETAAGDAWEFLSNEVLK